MRISDWSSDVCSSDLCRMISERIDRGRIGLGANDRRAIVAIAELDAPALILRIAERGDFRGDLGAFGIGLRPAALEITGLGVDLADREADRSEEHTSELQSLMRISYAVFCLKKKTSCSIQNTTLHYIKI